MMLILTSFTARNSFLLSYHNTIFEAFDNRTLLNAQKVFVLTLRQARELSWWPRAYSTKFH
jgi:hypothetical protein